MKTIVTVPTGHHFDVGLFSFGQMPPQDDVLVFPHTDSVGGFSFSNSTVTSLSFPNLVQIDPTDAQGGGLSFQTCTTISSFSAPLLSYVSGAMIMNGADSLASISLPSLTTLLGNGFPNADLGAPGMSIGGTALASFSAPLLATLGGSFDMDTTAAGLTTLSLPALSSVGLFVLGSFIHRASITANLHTKIVNLDLPLLGNVYGHVIFTNCPNLVSVNMPNFIPTHAAGAPPGSPITLIRFSGAKLNAASVNMILARCMANPAFGPGGDTVDLTGGTNAAPTGQGITDKANLIARGAVVGTN